jgi:hypothetical protein
MAESIPTQATSRLNRFAEDDTIARIWARDHTVWKLDPTELANRLGWLDIALELRAQVVDLESFAKQAAAAGFRHALLLGMGGSSLGPEVLRETFGVAAGMLDAVVLPVLASACRLPPPLRLMFVPLSVKLPPPVPLGAEIEFSGLAMFSAPVPVLLIVTFASVCSAPPARLIALAVALAEVID